MLFVCGVWLKFWWDYVCFGYLVDCVVGVDDFGVGVFVECEFLCRFVVDVGVEVVEDVFFV